MGISMLGVGNWGGIDFIPGKITDLFSRLVPCEFGFVCALRWRDNVAVCGGWRRVRWREPTSLPLAALPVSDLILSFLVVLRHIVSYLN